MNDVRWLRRRISLLIVLVLLGTFVLPVRAAATLELYGTFHSMGVIVSLDAGDDPDGDAVASVEYRESGDGAYRQGFPLTRVASTRFVGSLFFLEPGTAYDVRVTFSDPDGALNGVVVSDTASTRAEIVIPVADQSYYVSPDGTGSACSSASPCALQEALDQAQAGDEVVLRGGIYYEGEIELPRSGAPGAPIVIRSYPGEEAILDGSDPATFAWVAQGGGVYRTSVNVSDTHLVTANGQRLYPYESLGDVQSLAWGTPGFYANGTTLSVRLAGDADPNATTMVVSRYNHAFMVEQDYIYFVDLTIRHYGQGEYAKAIYFDGASWNLVQGCTFAINDLSIGLKRACDGNVIQQNEFYDTRFDWDWDGVKATHSLESGGITFYEPVHGRGQIIRENTFHDYFDGFGTCPESSDAVTNETDVYDNLVYRAGDDAISADGRCSNLRVWDNVFLDVLVGISLAPVYDGPVYAIRNLIYRTGVGNNDYTGTPFKFNSGYDTSGPMYLFHNTSDAVITDPRSHGLHIKTPGTWDLIYARNNIWAGTGYAISNSNADELADLDYDDVWNDGAYDLVRWDGTDYATLGAFSAATGQELHGLNVAPGFVDAAGGDYRLDAGSTLIDAGIPIPGINDGYGGSAPDIGAYEVASPGVPSLTLRAVPGNEQIALTWTVDGVLPPTSTWQINYEGEGSTVYLPVTGLISATRAYTLTELTNNVWYTVTLDAVAGSASIVNDTVRARPFDAAALTHQLYLPLVLKGF